MWMTMRVGLNKKAPCYQGASWSQLLLAVCIVCAICITCVISIKGGYTFLVVNACAGLSCFWWGKNHRK